MKNFIFKIAQSPDQQSQAVPQTPASQPAPANSQPASSNPPQNPRYQIKDPQPNQQNQPTQSKDDPKKNPQDVLNAIYEKYPAEENKIAQADNAKNGLENAYTLALQILDSRKNGSMVLSIKPNPEACSVLSSMNTDTTVVTKEEVEEAYQHWVITANKYIEILNQYQKAWEELIPIYNKIKSEDPVFAQKYSNDTSIQSRILNTNSGLAQTNNDLEIQTRKYKRYFAIMPIQEELMEVMGDLCVAEKTYERTKSTIGFGSRGEMQTLDALYSQAINLMSQMAQVAQQQSGGDIGAMLGKQCLMEINMLKNKQRTVLTEGFGKLFPKQ
jgi:hypothetical protein